MKNTIITALSLILGTLYAENKISIVDKPATTSQNSYYQGNRAPLTPSPLIKLPVGSVEPQGWLRENIQRQHKGLSGNLGEISAWLQKEDNAWLSKDGKGKWGWEELPYWLKGYANTAYMVNDQKAIEEATFWIKGAMNGQRENGDFGPIHFSPKRFGGGRDFWGNMIMLYCMQSYYEYSGDKQVLDVMGKYFKYQLSVPENKFLVGYWQKLRGGDNLHSVLWYYNETGDEFALELAKKIHKHTANWSSRGHGRKGIMGRQHKRHGMKEWPKFWGDLVDWHNVNLAQCFREPATFYQLSKDPKDLQASYDVFNIARKHFGQMPGGMYAGDENSRPGYDDPRQGVETCGLVEQMNSDQHMLRITGDTFWADHCEEVAFNMYPAAIMPDFKALRYFTAPNMVVSDTTAHAPHIGNKGPFLAMNPFSSRCCQHNHAQGWPYFAENLWMATPDNGLAAVIYSASSVKAKVANGEEVMIKQVSNYPFEEKITFKFETEKAVVFPFYLRVPKWAKGASVSINGEKQSVELVAAKFLKIKRSWKNGDQVVLDLPMEVSTKVYEKNHNAMSVHYGALTFSLKIKEKAKPFASNKHTIFDSKWRDDVDMSKWPAYELFSDSPWNYGLDLKGTPEIDFEVVKKAWPSSDYPFTADSAPIRIYTKARRIPEWQAESTGFCGELQDSPVKTTQKLEDIELIPLGSARLRISAFPVVGHGDDAIKWEADKYQASASAVGKSDSLAALYDGKIPNSSGDTSMSRHSFWPKKGSQEWLAYDLLAETEVKSVSVYWFDDSSKGGGCALPRSWKLQYKTKTGWKDAEVKGAYGTAKDKMNVITLKKPVKATALRLIVQLQPSKSGGVYEWSVN